MITFIIPTLWRSDKIKDTIESIKLSDRKDLELIIIDNSNSDFKDKDPRITVIKVKNNIFVNPAWNIGATLARNNYICLLNDDISLNVNCLLNNFKELVKSDLNFGMIGLYKRNFNVEPNTYNSDFDKLQLVELDYRPFGFGCMMILKKENYVKIPDIFRVFFGDDYLYFYNKDMNHRKIYWIEGLKTPGEISVTSKDFDSDHMQQEYAFWDQEINTLINKNK
jgi:glycosyltransferase involved in cell wall biosynthesis